MLPPAAPPEPAAGPVPGPGEAVGPRPPGPAWPLAPVLLGGLAGTALQLQQPRLWPALVYVGFVASAHVLIGFIALKKRAGRGQERHGRGPAAWGRVLAWVLAGALLAAGACGLRAGQRLAQGLDPALEGRDLRVTGVVDSMPQRSEAGLRFRLAVEAAEWQGQAVRLPPRLDLGWYGARGAAAPALGELDGLAAPEALRAGERWRFTLRLRAPHGNLNPGGFDHELWLWEQGLHASGYVRSGPRDAPPERLAQTGQHPVEQARQAVRERLLARVAEPRLAGVLAALVTGDQAAIARADWDVFRATGVAHLMSISGLHITGFAWLAAALLGAAWRRSVRLCLAWPAPSAAQLGGLLLATAYALFSGWGVPAQRTVGMLACVVLLRLSGRRWPWPQVWLLAAAVVVAADPWALLQAGFWLSFVAVGVLQLAQERTADGAAAPASAPGWLRRGAAQGLARAAALWREQWLVTLALAPLSLLLFGQVSLVGLLANLVAIPWVTGVVTPLALLGVLWAPLWDAAALALQGLGAWLQALAAWPLATLAVAGAPAWVGAGGLLGALLLALRLPLAWRGLGLPLLLPLLLWQAPRPPEGTFELLAADVGQGNAVLLRTHGHSLLYDAGPRYSLESDAGHRVLVPLLRHLGEPLDVLLLSHRDSDHTGGAAALLAMQPQARLVSSIEPGHALQAMRPAQRCEAGQAWTWDGVRFELLHPAPEDYAPTARPNALSCVLRVSAAGQSVLLVGDIEQAQERLLLARQPEALAATLLLVPHHGSKTSSSPAFLDAVGPRWALVQAGYRNRFGHPAPAVLERYHGRQVAVRQSAACGAARWWSGEPGRVHCEREDAARYWHHRPPP